MEWTVAGITYEWSPDWWQAWAGWAQALGSMAAIYASYLFGRAEADRATREAVEARRREDDARTRQEADVRLSRTRDRETAAALMSLASELLRNGADGMSEFRAPGQVVLASRAMRDQLSACDKRILNYPVELLRDPALVSMFAAGQLQVAMAVAYTSDIGSRDTSKFPPDASSEFAKQLQIFRSNLDIIRGQFIGIMAQEAEA